MDAPTEVHGEAALVRGVHIDSLVGPFLWVKWANAALLTVALYIPLGITSAALHGQFDSIVIGLALILIFPCWIAWKNINVIDSLTQRYTITSLLVAGGPVVALSLLSLPLLWGFEVSGSRLGSLTIWGLVGGSLTCLGALAVWRLRHCRIDSLGVKLLDILNMLSPQPARAGLRNIRPQRPLLGLALIATAAIMMVGNDFIPAWPVHLLKQYGISQIVFGCLIILAQSAFQPNAAAVIKADSRKPVLLLRSFIDDERLKLRLSTDTLFDTSLESRLISHFTRYGPFIAVGAPYERIPIIGAARIKLTDAQWQDQVIRWIDDSIVILLMAGTTDWLEWELNQVIAHDAMDRLIICFPQIRSRKWKDRSLRNFSVNMNARLNRLQQVFAKTRWSSALRQLDDAQSLRSLVFGRDGRLTVIRARSRNRNAYHLATLVAHWIGKAGIPDTPIGSVRPASKRRLFWDGCRFAPAFAAYSCGALMLCPTVMYEVGLIYENGLGVAHNYGKARRWLQRAADAGNADAANELGILYTNGQGVSQDHSKSRQLYEKAAKSGNVLAMSNLGLLYERGWGGTRDYAKARDWFQKAADAGNVIAMSELGFLYANGFGVAQDYAKARDWFQKAADAGNVMAMNELGLLYANGFGVAQDYAKARDWFQKAADAGNALAMFNLGLLYANGFGVAQDYAKARECFQKAADAGNAFAMNNLGLLYANGFGVAQDYAKARDWFQKAADAGNMDAKEALTRLPQPSDP